MFQFTSEDLASRLSSTAQPVVVDFWAEWCSPCVDFTRVLDEIATELDGQVVVGGLDIGAFPDVAARYGVASIPTALLFVDGEPVRRLQGPRPKRHVLREIQTLL